MSDLDNILALLHSSDLHNIELGMALCGQVEGAPLALEAHQTLSQRFRAAHWGNPSLAERISRLIRETAATVDAHELRYVSWLPHIDRLYVNATSPRLVFPDTVWYSKSLDYIWFFDPDQSKETNFSNAELEFSASMQALPHLRSMGFSQIEFSKAPRGLENLRSLRELFFSRVRATIRYDWIAEVPHLEFIKILYTPEFRCQLPADCALQRVDIDRNPVGVLWPMPCVRETKISLASPFEPLEQLPELFPNLEQLFLENADRPVFPNGCARWERLRMLRVQLARPLQASLLWRLELFLKNMIHKNLEIVVLSQCNLSDVPQALGDFKKIRRLYLQNNALETLPDFLAQLPQLEHLNLCHNRLTELPKWVFERLEAGSLALYAEHNPLRPGQIEYLQQLGAWREEPAIRHFFDL